MTVWKAAFIKAVFTLAVCVFSTLSAWADINPETKDFWYITDKEPTHYFDGGEGTQSSPYLISNAQSLADLAWFVNNGESFKGKYFKMTNDFKFNSFHFENDVPVDNNDWTATRDWVPIGKYGTWSDKYFEGIFDGDGHKIEGLKINAKDYDYGGLFGCVKNAIIRNLTIDNSYLHYDRKDAHSKGNCQYGMLVGYLSKSQLVNCHVTNSIINVFKWEEMRDCVGGLVGQGSGDGKTLSSCSFENGKIKICWKEGHGYVAGLMGLGAATYKYCKVNNTTIECEYVDGGDIWNARDNCFSGLCYEAEDIIDCVSNVTFHIHDDKEEHHLEDKHDIYAYTLCYQAKNISQSSSISNFKIEGNFKVKEDFWGNVHKASSVTDCAFYTKMDCSKLYHYKDWENQGGNNVYYYPLGVEQKDISKVSSVVVLNDNGTVTPSTDPLVKTGIKPILVTSSNGTLFTGGVDELKKTEVLGKLNNPSYQSVLWGKIDGDGEFAGCPLPVACGGKTDEKELNGDGTKDSPYLIGTPWDLTKLATRINEGTIKTEDKYFQLSADIDMSASDAIDEIGSDKTTHPFRGTFDGNGHVISNITYKGAALFGYMFGTVKNLAIVGIKRDGATVYTGTVSFGGIASSLGLSTPTEKGTIENCYVGGDLIVRLPAISGTTSTQTTAYVGGLCSYINNGTIKNSYFKGRIMLNNENGYLEKVGGIAGGSYTHTLQDSYASYSVTGNGTNLTVHGLVGSLGKSYGYTQSNCYAVCDQITKSSSSSSASLLDGTVCASDKEILDKFTYTDGSAWIKGAYRPILGTARHYDVTAADDTDAKAYYDAIPMVDDKNADNTIWRYTLKNDGDATDPLLWSLPNLSIYSEKEQRGYILNCTLVPTKPFVYKQIGYHTKANMHYPLALSEDKNYYMLCLPGAVTSNALPEGSKILIVGKVLGDDGNKYANLLMVDSVPAGVPFIAWIPEAYTKANKTIDIVMRSEMKNRQVSQIDYGGSFQNVNLKGTFTELPNQSNVCAEVKKNSNSDYKYLATNSEAQTIKPFSSYLESSEDVKLYDCLMLSETSNETDKLLNTYNGKEDMDIMLERTLKKDQWNTICLPFSMSADEVTATFGQKTILDKFISIDATIDGGCKLYFSRVDDGIEAGKCYLIKPTQDFSVSKLKKRTISNEQKNDVKTVTLKDGSSATIALCGTFISRILGNEKYSDMEGVAEEYFLQGQKIYHVVKGHNIVMNGFRCYITADMAAAQALSRAIVVHGDGTTTSLRMIEVGTSADGNQRIYDLQGIERQAEGLQRGVYIKGGHKYMK